MKKDIPEKSLLDLKILIADKIIEKCEFCEHKCKVNRNKQLGICQLPNKLLISSEFVHWGEESYFIPSHTIFFYSCNMLCKFCQNFTISYRLEKPIEITPKKLAEIIDYRRTFENTRNLNLVGGEPTPHLNQILKILKNVETNIPVIWNSNMYMSEISMELLNGIIDVYLADFKFGNNECARRYTIVRNYFDIITRNLKIASKQAEIVIRHLILPNHLECCTFKVLKWISENLKEKALVNLMDQYFPYWKAQEFPEINRRITVKEFSLALRKALELGIAVKD